MKVGIDVAPLVQTQAGTARWIQGLLGELEHRPGLDVRRLSWGGPGRVRADVRDVVWYPALLPLAAARQRLDVVHCTIFRAPLRSRVPVAVTVYDLAVLRHPDAFPLWTRTYGRTMLLPTLRAAAKIVTISEFTKGEVIELAGVPEDRVAIVPCAVDDIFQPVGPAADGDYLLAVGTLEPRKNLAVAVQAARLAGLELRVVGASGWGDVQIGGDGVRWLGRSSDEELARLYRGAQCLVYPSLYEGFGIPVAEAMACGTPVVTSAHSAMSEVAGGAAVLVDPRDPEAVAAGIAEAIARRDELSALGLERSKVFTWSAAADAAEQVYRSLA